MLEVTAFTQGRDVPSARFRVRQYVPALRGLGIALTERVAPLGAYPPARGWARPLWGAAALAANLPRVAASWRHDVTLLQREAVSTLVTIEGLTRRPRVLDVDDAIFVHRGGATARRLAGLCDGVICGNAFLAEWFGRAARNVVVVPTAVDADRYAPRARPPGAPPVLGWIGTSGNARYLAAVEEALRRALEAVPGARLRVVSDRPLSLPGLPADRVDQVRWSERGELDDLLAMDVGIMPLEDSVWARGKCSFKMLQYMACGLPVVVSPVGMNAELLGLGACGEGPSGAEAWVEALVGYLRDPALRARAGAEGRRIVEAGFSVRAVAPRLARALGAHAPPSTPGT